MDLALVVEHMEWADRRTAGSVRDLSAEVWEASLPSSYGSLAGTVEHLFATEWTWLERVSGRSPTTVGPAGGARDRARLMALWEPVWQGWREVAVGRPPAEVVPYRTSRGTPNQHTVFAACAREDPRLP